MGQLETRYNIHIEFVLPTTERIIEAEEGYTNRRSDAALIFVGVHQQHVSLLLCVHSITKQTHR